MRVPTTARAARERISGLLLAQVGLVAALAATGICASAFSLGLTDAVLPASVLVSLVVAWNFYSWHLLGRELFSPYGMFLLSASLFHGGQAGLEVLGLNPNGVLDGLFEPKLIVMALYMAALGLAALHLGAIWAASKAPKNGPSQMDPHHEERSRASCYVGWFCILLAAFPTALILRDVLSTVARSGYIGLYDPNRDSVVTSTTRMLAANLMPGVMFLAVGSPKRRLVHLGLWSIVIGYSGSMILSGLRHEGAPLLISFAWLYHTRIRRLPRTAILSAGVALLALFGIVSITRCTGLAWLGSIAETRATSAVAESPIVTTLSEMGGTLATVAHTVDLVPSNRPFDYGVGYAYTLLCLMPRFGWDVHPSVTHGSYSDWMSRTVDPVSAAHGLGLGYSFIAEPFANFGWYGVVPLLAMIGYLLVRMSDWATQKNDPPRYAAVASFLAFFLFFPRAESSYMIRPLVYFSLLPYTVVGILANTRKSHERRAGTARIRGPRPASRAAYPATPAPETGRHAG